MAEEKNGQYKGREQGSKNNPKAEPAAEPGLVGIHPDGRMPRKFTPEVQANYLYELAQTGLLIKSANAVGVHSYTVNKLRQESPEFEAAVQHALAEYQELLVKEAHRRAVEGWEERPIVDKDGCVVGHVRKFSDSLLLAKLKRGDPAFREKVEVNANATVQGIVGTVPLPDLDQLDAAGRKALRTVLQQLGPPAIEVEAGSED